MSRYNYGNELINIAVGIEKQGLAFYDTMVRSTENTETQEIFRDLVDMERNHIKMFEDMLSEAEDYQSGLVFPQEYEAHIKALVDNAVFTDELATSEMASKVNNDTEAIELGIRAEKDSILFYYIMKESMHQRAQTTINKIISEEKSHLKQLAELKKKLATL